MRRRQSLNGLARPLIQHLLRIGVVAAVALVGSPAFAGENTEHAHARRVLFVEQFAHANGPNGLITNEYADRHPGDPLAVRSAKWQTTSGSLFVSHGVGWTGVPDGCRPDRFSRLCTDSAVFRLHTRRFDFRNAQVTLQLLNHSLTTTARTPARAIDGVHLWLRYQSETELYAVSVNRRDNTVVIKKKCPGGPSNGGTYYTLAKPTANQPIPFGVWQQIVVSVRNNTDGSVTLTLTRDHLPLAAATDNGLGCPPIRTAGAIGIRGDNDNFSLRNLEVTTLPG